MEPQQKTLIHDKKIQQDTSLITNNNYSTELLQSLSEYSNPISSNTSAQTSSIYLHKQYKIIVSQPKPNLYYFPISTEPSRKFKKSYFCVRDIDNCQIVIELRVDANLVGTEEKFSVLGYNRGTNCIQEILRCGVEEYVCSAIQCTNPVLFIARQAIQVQLSISPNQFDIHQATKLFPPTQLRAQQIQILLEFVQKNYGSFENIKVKKNILVVELRREQFEHKDAIHDKEPFIISKRVREVLTRGSAGDPNKLFKYYTITTHRPLFYTSPCSLIQFPPETRVRFLQLFERWVIIATDTDVMFFHVDSPLDNFLTLSDLYIRGISRISNDKIALMQYKYLHIYQVSSRKKPKFINKCKIRKLQLFTGISISNGDFLLAGIDQSAIMNSRVKEKYVHLIKGLAKTNFTNKQSLYVDDSMLVCVQNQNRPILYLTYIESAEAFVCSCGEKIYLCHFGTQSVLAQVELKGKIRKIQNLDYPINIANILLLTSGHNQSDSPEKKKIFVGLIRVGFDESCSIIGTQVQNIKQNGENIRDFIIQNQKTIYLTDGQIITARSGVQQPNRIQMIVDEIPTHYEMDKITQNNQIIEISKKPNPYTSCINDQRYIITKLKGGQDELVFSAKKQHTVEIYYLQV